MTSRATTSRRRGLAMQPGDAPKTDVVPQPAVSAATHPRIIQSRP